MIDKHLEQRYQIVKVRNDSYRVENFNHNAEINKFWAYKHEITNYTRLIQQLEGEDLDFKTTVLVLKHIYRQLMVMTKCSVEIANQDFIRCKNTMTQRLTDYQVAI